MSGEQRLDRLYPALTAKERGLLVLHAYKAGEQPDLQIYTTTPSAQGAALNRYIRLMNAVNVELATALHLVREQVEKTDLKYSWMMSLLIWGMETHVLGERVLAATKDRKLRKDVRRVMARAAGNLEVPVDLTLPEEIENGLGDELVRALLFGIRRDLRQHWCELRAVEVVVEEIAEEFSGEDPMQPAVREMLEDGLLTCTKLRDDTSAYAEIELSEPTDDDVAQVRRLIMKIVDG